jgi:hypothetical protein
MARKAMAAGLMAAGLMTAAMGNTLLLATPVAHAEVYCNNGRETRATCHPIGPSNPGVCQPDPGGSPAQLAFFWMCDEYGFRSKLALDRVAVTDLVEAIKLGYAICETMPPPTSDDPWSGTPAAKAAETMVLSSGVVAPGLLHEQVTRSVTRPDRPVRS